MVERRLGRFAFSYFPSPINNLISEFLKSCLIVANEKQGWFLLQEDIFSLKRVELALFAYFQFPASANRLLLIIGLTLHHQSEHYPGE